MGPIHGFLEDDEEAWLSPRSKPSIPNKETPMSNYTNEQVVESLRVLSERVEALSGNHKSGIENILAVMKENIAIEARKSSVLDHLASHVIQLQAGQQILMDAMMGMQQTMHMLLQNSSIARPGIYNHPVQVAPYHGRPTQQWAPGHGYQVNSGGGRTDFRPQFSGQPPSSFLAEIANDYAKIEHLLSLVRDTNVPSGVNIDPYVRMVIDLGAHLLRGTAVDSKNTAPNRGIRFFVFDDQNAGYLVFLVPDIAWSNRVNTQQTRAETVCIYTTLVFTKTKSPNEKQINQIMEEVLHRFHAANQPGSSGIASMSAFTGIDDLRFPYQSLNFEQPILNLGNHPHHYLSFNTRGLIAPVSRYGNL